MRYLNWVLAVVVLVGAAFLVAGCRYPVRVQAVPAVDPEACRYAVIWSDGSASWLYCD